MNKLAIAAILGLAVSPLWAIQGTISTATDSKRGDIKWQARAKKYTVTVKTKGGAPVEMEFKASDVTGLDIPKPAGYDKAVEAVQRGQGASAIGTLTKIVNDYKMLQWDRPAGRYLVEAHIAVGNAQKAYEIATSIIADDKKAAFMGDLAPAYWQALLKLGKTQQLQNCLKRAATSNDRVASAEAVLMRGDVIIAEGGESPAVFRQALGDSYLRVALMYSDPACRDVCADAKLKAAKCFDKLGMAARAEQFRAEARARR